MSGTLVAVVVVALLFDFTNGFHDTANAIATSVSTRALRPRVAVCARRAGRRDLLEPFEHQGLTPADECYEVCATAWGSLMHGSLPRLIETSAGEPYPRVFDEHRA